MTVSSLRYKYVPTGTVWPSGDFSCGSKKVWLTDPPTDADLAFNPDVYNGEAPEYTRTHDAIAMWVTDKVAQMQVYDEMQAAWENPAALDDWLGPLDLTDAPNSHKPSNRPESYGRQGMTGYGKKMVRSACALLERRYKGRLTFATVTMPTLPPDLRRELAIVWPEFLRQALQWLSRQLQKQQLPKAVVSVTEIQPSRLQAGNGGYLHLHMVWPNRVMKKGFHSVDVLKFRAWCESFLVSRGLWDEGAWVNVDTQPVEVSAAAYLSKYMSKGGDCLEAFVDENGWEACPGQWWNMTKGLRDAVKRETVSGPAVGEWLESMVEYALHTCDGSAFWSVRTVDMEFEGRFLTVGYCGILKSEHQRYIRDSVLSMVDTRPEMCLKSA